MISIHVRTLCICEFCVLFGICLQCHTLPLLSRGPAITQLQSPESSPDRIEFGRSNVNALFLHGVVSYASSEPLCLTMNRTVISLPSHSACHELHSIQHLQDTQASSKSSSVRADVAASRGITTQRAARGQKERHRSAQRRPVVAFPSMSE